MRRVIGVVLLGLVLMAPASPASSATRYRDIVFSEIKVKKDIPYGKAVNHSGAMQTLLLDVHEPVGDTSDHRAAVVWVHGGYFIRGSKNSESYQPAIQQFVRAGYVTFAINYRLQDEDVFPDGAGAAVTSLQMQRYIDAVKDAQHDAQAAVRFVRRYADKYRVNPERVAIVGHSAGGITAEQVNYNSDDEGSSGNPGWSSRPDAAVSSAGTGLPGLLTKIDFMEPPMLFSHGLADDVVPFMPFNCLTAIALANTCEFSIDPDQDHGMFGMEYWREFLYRQMIAKPDGIRPTTKVTVTGLPTG